MPIFERQISQGADDGYIYWYQSSWTHSPTGVNYATGAYDASSIKHSSWVEFRNNLIPPEAVIDAAKLNFISYGPNSAGPVNSKIRAVAEDSPSPPPSAADYLARTLTTHETLWDNIPAWETDGSYDSPDFKDVIQEIINREGWQQGNNILIFWDDLDDRSSHTLESRRRPRSYDSDPTKAATLTIEYHEAPVAGIPKGSSMAAKMIGAGLL